MSRRSYDQYCGLARALDVVGGRWTLLVIRELLIGPKRFVDLEEGLPGIGPNGLSARLKALEADGLVTKRRLPRPAASTVYELTDRGRQLEPALMALIRWGFDLLGTPRPGDTFQPGWLVTALRALFEPGAAAGIEGTYVLSVDGEVFTARLHAGELDVRQGDSDDADVRIAIDPDTLLAIGAGELTPAEALDHGHARVEQGDREEALAFADLLALPRMA